MSPTPLLQAMSLANATLAEPLGRAPAARQKRAWLPRVQRWHYVFMVPITLQLTLLMAVTPELSETIQLALLAAAVAVFGLPHGALDHLPGRAAFEPRFGRWWALPFSLSYLVAAAVVLALWIVLPRTMLCVFLAYSAWHFGSGDLAEAPKGVSRRLEAAARGALVLALPALFQSTDVTIAFNWLLPASLALPVETVRTWSLACVLVAGLTATATAVWRAGEGRLSRAPEQRPWLELLALLPLFALAPPLLSFLVYFCFWHSPRHLMELAADLSPTDSSAAFRRLVRAALPLTLLTLAGAAIAFQLLLSGGLSAEQSLARVLFIGLAALTVPHMLLASLHDRSG